MQRITAVSPQHSFAVERRGYQAKKGESPTVLAPADAPWVLRRPEAALADQEEVKRLLEMAIRTQIAAAIVGEDQEPDTSIYGLIPPEGVFTLEGGFGKGVLSFGKKIAISGRRYAQPEGDPRLYVIEDALASALLGEKSKFVRANHSALRLRRLSR